MAASAHFLQLFQLLAIASLALVMPIYAQINSPCSPSMITSFAPCMAFVTNSSAAGAPPTPACCSALQTISSNGTECMCQIVSGSPFQVPINRTLAISLPRACNMPGVPLQCKAAGAPASAPGPAAFSPSLSPEAPAPLSPQASNTLPTSDSPGLAPEAETTPELTPPSTNTVSSQAPTANSGSRPVVTTSAAHPPASVSPSLLLTLFGAFVLKCNYY
ncbi:hypothetical protein RHSIM_Rhsim04G0200100 [Rhododendron simsii]|uniref:Bifunctional inhibitor/plant lipid transfer protein/seed storage helical domain-containing protein n=1 Tax=Rhododendron simsii TaxID=118357 RepID=A0A834LRH0_RHOSS|nr:hypothetical protein RHSIM_Rhsim04G0200100 [Rhododendron simsii]